MPFQATKGDQNLEICVGPPKREEKKIKPLLSSSVPTETSINNAPLEEEISPSHHHHHPPPPYPLLPPLSLSTPRGGRFRSLSDRPSAASKVFPSPDPPPCLVVVVVMVFILCLLLGGKKIQSVNPGFFFFLFFSPRDGSILPGGD